MSDPGRSPPDTARGYSDEEASRIWRRAAELQASRRLPQPAAAGDEGSKHPARRDLLSPEEVVAIASEAGIEPEFVQQAVAEAQLLVPAVDAGPDFAPIVARRTVSADLLTVREALQEVAARAPFHLRLVDVQRAGEATMLLFDLGQVRESKSVGESFHAGYIAAGFTFAGIRAVVRPGDVPGITDVLLQGAPNPRLPRRLRRHEIGFGSIGAVIGGGLGVVGGTMAALGGAAILAPAALGAAALGAGSARVFREVQRWARRQDNEALERLATEVVGSVRLRRELGPGMGNGE
jgi:hypothetical protein